MSMELSPPAIGGIRPAAPATEPVKTLGFDPSIPATDNELIMMNNLNPSPSASAVNALENNDSASSSNNSSAQILRARLQLSAICWSLFLAGWNDGTSGPLIPRMQNVYHASFLVVSLVFVVSSLGFISGAAVNMHWTDKQGFGRLMVFGIYSSVLVRLVIIQHA
ncbi:hypothetical protein B0H16DRAFT_1502951 [Mycena metata]|uniref:Uncharacterized protein n=1 Tax=Mycena metata TaxID=1033252 RepID=A0AAD7K4X0_9AGAR|nr:hypothetical protein B0H16DRAFT_1502951 [Mycena metata]